MERIAAHLKHFIQIGGEDCVGIGTDFDGICGNFSMFYQRFHCILLLLIHNFVISYFPLLLEAHLEMVDLSGTKSIEELQQRIRQYIIKNRINKGEWIRGRGWNQDCFSTFSLYFTSYPIIPQPSWKIPEI